MWGRQIHIKGVGQESGRASSSTLVSLINQILNLAHIIFVQPCVASCCVVARAVNSVYGMCSESARVSSSTWFSLTMKLLNLAHIIFVQHASEDIAVVASCCVAVLVSKGAVEILGHTKALYKTNIRCTTPARDRHISMYVYISRLGMILSFVIYNSL